MKVPIKPPTNRKIKTYINPLEKFPIDKNVTVIAIIIPIIPKKLPCLDVSGDDKPLKAKINYTPEIKYKIADKFAEIIIYPFSFFYTWQAFFGLPKNLQKYLLLLEILPKIQKYSKY